MNKVIAWLKGLQMARILTIFLVGLLMFVSTACNGGASAKTPGDPRIGKTADQIRQEVPSSAVTNEYKGGMNDYSDVDPRFNPKQSEAKAKGLVDNAQKNINEKSIDSREQYVENYRNGAPLGERVGKIGENVGKAAENVTGEASKGAQENLQNAQEVGKDVAQKGKQTADQAGYAAESKVKSDIKNTQRTLDKTANAGENLGDRIKQAAQKAADAID